MPRVSAKRRQMIYDAVCNELMQLRVHLQREHRDKVSAEIDAKIARAMDDAASAAVRAATGEEAQR